MDVFQLEWGKIIFFHLMDSLYKPDEIDNDSFRHVCAYVLRVHFWKKMSVQALVSISTFLHVMHLFWLQTVHIVNLHWVICLKNARETFCRGREENLKTITLGKRWTIVRYASEFMLFVIFILNLCYTIEVSLSFCTQDLQSKLN